MDDHPQEEENKHERSNKQDYNTFIAFPSSLMTTYIIIMYLQ